MQLTSVPLLNITLILIFSIITFTIEQTTTYMKRRKATRVTISLKCTNSVELNLIESTCTFFSFMSFDSSRLERIASIKTFTKLCEQKSYSHATQHESLLTFSHHEVLLRCAHSLKKTASSQ